jgi:phage gpG-like protein
MAFNVTMVGDREVVQRFTDMPLKVHQALLVEIVKQTLDLQAHVVQDKLQGQVLNHISGKLQSSIQHDVNDGGTSIIGRVYSNKSVSYAGIHEFGGPFRTRLGTGKGPPKPGGKEFGMMPERSFLRSSLQDYRQRIVDGITNAAKKAVAEV